MNFTLSAPQHTMTVQTSTTTLVLQRAPVELTLAMAGIAGAKGVPGTPGGSLSQAIAGETLSGHVVVAYDADGLVYKASQNNDSALRVAGVTTGAVVSGEQATIQRSDVLDWPANNLVHGLVFLGVGGEVTQIQPSTGYVVVVGAAISANKICVELGAIFQA